MARHASIKRQHVIGYRLVPVYLSDLHSAVNVFPQLSRGFNQLEVLFRRYKITAGQQADSNK